MPASETIFGNIGQIINSEKSTKMLTFCHVMNKIAKIILECLVCICV